ncbi:MAG: hypothetical protein ACE5GY_01585 [Thermodesulfobacteriota bacterium]
MKDKIWTPAQAEIPTKEECCPVCGNRVDDCICCPECGHECVIDQGELYCPVCGPEPPKVVQKEETE